MGLTIFILILALTILVDAYTDANRISEGKAVNHLRGALIRLVPLTAGTMLITTHLFYMVLWLAVAGAFYWLIFDIVLNLFRGLPWYYQGIVSDSEEDSFTDSLIDEMPIVLMLLAKIGMIVLTIAACNQRARIEALLKAVLIHLANWIIELWK
ncbi:hypothetical protein [Xanthocytophaga agilis]|uniref:Uncharacterized protein n=1 Tax=Xanthocytophaga agilis TaxID=3048010 RepID=A0AAE3UDL5_9BACT|nr:hypothetical protein [Xanthocytophaga agilis]MDJ1500476.1 hypothetical protein [Xanthocytophaga agilis]